MGGPCTIVLNKLAKTPTCKAAAVGILSYSHFHALRGLGHKVLSADRNIR